LISKISHPFFRGIYQVKFSPDGKTAAAASWEFLPKQSPPVQGFAVVMSLPQGEIIQRINTDNHPASSVDFSISGEKLITATWGFYVKQHDIKSGKDDWTYDLNDIGYYAAFQSCDVSPDGNRIVTGGKDNQVRMLDAATGKLLYLIQPHMGHSKWVNAVRFSGDGKLFASGSDDQLIKVWESASGKLVATLNGHTHNINGLVFSNDNTTLYSSSSDGTIKKWDIRKSGHRQIAVCKSGPWYAPVSDDGKWLVAACSDSSTLLWDLEAGTAAMDVKGRAISGAISPDNRYAAAGNREIYLLDLEKKKHVATVKGHTKTIYGMDWLRSKNFLATASDDRTVRIWNEKGDSVNMIRVNTGSPYSVVFSPDQRSMYVGMTNGLIKKYNTSNWQETDSLKPGKDLANLRIDPSGQYLLTCGQKGQLYLWNIAQRKIRALEGHTNHIYGIAFHPDGKYAISVSYDQSLKLWDLASGQCVLTLKEFTGELYTISITNKGKRIIAGQTDGVVHILDF
jgi:WD40 repeat protein